MSEQTTPCGCGCENTAAEKPSISNWLWQSIVVTVCCCLPLGIVAIIFAAQVNSKLAAGDIVGATDSAGKAKMFCILGFCLGIIGNIIIACLQLLPLFMGNGE